MAHHYAEAVEWLAHLSGVDLLAVAMAGNGSSALAVARVEKLLSHEATRSALLNEVVRNGVFPMIEFIASRYKPAELIDAYRLAARLGRGDFALRLIAQIGGRDLCQFVGSAMRQEMLECAAASCNLNVLQLFQRTWNLGPQDIPTTGPTFDALRKFLECGTQEDVFWILANFVLAEPPSTSAAVDGLGFGIGSNPALSTAQLVEIATEALYYARIDADDAGAIRRNRAVGFLKTLVDGAVYAGKTDSIEELIRFSKIGVLAV